MSDERLLGVLIEFKSNTEKHQEKIESMLEKHNERIDSLEGTRHYAYGIIAAVGALAGIAGSYIGKAFAAILGAH